MLDDVQMGEKKFAQMYILGHNVGRVHVAEGKQETVLISELLQLNAPLYQCCGSMPFWCGSRSADPCL